MKHRSGSRQLLAATLLLLGAPCLGALGALGAADNWLAPDGERGLRPQRETVSLFCFARDPEDVRFLRELWSLPREVRTSLQLALAGHRRLGALDLLQLSPAPPGSPVPADALEQLARLHSTYALVERDPGARRMDAAQARAFARLVLDDAFHLRARLLDGLELELRELDGVLALLLASGRGVAALADTERDFEALLARGDLAAARLRQIDRDLKLLARPIAPRVPPSVHPDEARLVELLLSGSASELSSEFGKLLERVRMQRARLLETLKTPAFDERERAALASRARSIARAKELLEELSLLIPATTEGRTAPGDIQALSDSERYERAIALGLSACSVDPLQPRLAYLCGLAVDFRHGGRSSARYFDRFLALSGIRFYDGRTYSERELGPEQRRALAAVREQ